MVTFALPSQDPTGAYSFPSYPPGESCAETHYLKLGAAWHITQFGQMLDDFAITSTCRMTSF